MFFTAYIAKPTEFFTFNFLNKFFLCESTVLIPKLNLSAISGELYSFDISFKTSNSLSVSVSLKNYLVHHHLVRADQQKILKEYSVYHY